MYKVPILQEASFIELKPLPLSQEDPKPHVNPSGGTFKGRTQWSPFLGRQAQKNLAPQFALPVLAASHLS